MRNDQALRLIAALLCLTSPLRGVAAPGSWFADSACPRDGVPVVPSAGARALLSVHHQPGLPPHEALLLMGHDGVWRAPRAEWARWTQRAAAETETSADGEHWVPLKPHADFAMRLDSCSAELWIDADPERLQVTTLDRPAPLPVSVAGHGGFLNLDAQYGGLAGANTVNGLVDVGVFSAAGSGRSGFFVNNRRLQRLDTRWTHDNPAEAMRLTLGDSVTRGADWESAARFGGIQWGADFSLQPDRITFPLPTIAGSAALPSTAELYVNGQRQSQQNLQPGNFRFDSVPTLTGLGELSVVVRDALGREQTVRQSFYTSPRLLAEGLTANTFEAGLLRQNFATSHDRYRQAFVGATLQRGLQNNLTGVLRAVGSAQRSQLGGELDWIAAPYGVISISAAAAHTEAGWGGIATIAIEHTEQQFSVGLRRRLATRAYGDLGRAPGALHFSDAARASLNLHAAGSVSLLYVSEQSWNSQGGGQGARLAGIAYSRSLGPRVQAYASALHALAGSGGDNVVIGFSAIFGRGTSGGVQWTQDERAGAASFGVQHSPDGKLGWSYGAAADGRDKGIRQAQVAVATERGSFGLGAAGFGSHAAASASVQTGIALLDGHSYWTRPVQQSFAAVETGEVAGVHVYRENQLVGTTGAGGRLLVPDLLPFTANQLSIDDHDLPMGVSLLSADSRTVPPANAGVSVRFAVSAEKSQAFRLVDSQGVPIAAGTLLRLDGQPLPLPVGYDGLVYAELGTGEHGLEAGWAGGSCSSRVRVTALQAKATACLQAAP